MQKQDSLYVNACRTISKICSKGKCGLLRASRLNLNVVIHIQDSDSCLCNQTYIRILVERSKKKRDDQLLQRHQLKVVF